MCGVTKDISEFGNHSCAKDGKFTRCKECRKKVRQRKENVERRKIVTKIRRIENHEEILNKERIYKQSDKVKAGGSTKKKRKTLINSRGEAKKKTTK